MCKYLLRIFQGLLTGSFQTVNGYISSDNDEIISRHWHRIVPIRYGLIDGNIARIGL